jgi:hypothetical protein
MLILSIVFTVLLYVFIGYLSYVTASILYRGMLYRLILPTVKAIAFIATSYISIITDVVLYSLGLHSSIVTKNGMLLLLIVMSIVTASSRKERDNGLHQGK